MKGSIFIVLGLAWCLSISTQLLARAGQFGEDPFPTACISLVGRWISEDMTETYTIRQNGCDRLNITRDIDGFAYRVEVAPNGKPFFIKSPSWGLVESYKWDSNKTGNALIAHRTYTYKDRSIQEEIQLERIEDFNLLREIHKRKTVMKNGNVIQQIGERYLRRAQ